MGGCPRIRQQLQQCQLFNRITGLISLSLGIEEGVRDWQMSPHTREKFCKGEPTPRFVHARQALTPSLASIRIYVECWRQRNRATDRRQNCTSCNRGHSLERKGLFAIPTLEVIISECAQQFTGVALKSHFSAGVCRTSVFKYLKANKMLSVVVPTFNLTLRSRGEWISVSSTQSFRLVGQPCFKQEKTRQRINHGFLSVAHCGAGL